MEVGNVLDVLILIDRIAEGATVGSGIEPDELGGVADGDYPENGENDGEGGGGPSVDIPFTVSMEGNPRSSRTECKR